MTRFKTLPYLLSLLVCASCATMDKGSARKKPGVSITKGENDSLKIDVDGKLFAVYNPTGGKRPYFYPVYGPSGKLMVRNWPMKDLPNEEHDHPHHQGIWFGHREVNGMTFWDNDPKGGVQKHEKFTHVRSGHLSGQFTEKVQWVDKNGKEVCRDERTIHIVEAPDARIMDFEITIFANKEDLTFGDDKDGLMAIRVAPTMRVKLPKEWNNRKAGSKPGNGHLVTSEGDRDESAWGKRGNWCDYYGPVDGETVGVAIFDHPDNLRHPTWWHARDYGLLAANPFGQHNFENIKNATPGEFHLSKGKSLTFKYRFYFHTGTEVDAQIAKHYDEYIRETAMHLTSR